MKRKYMISFCCLFALYIFASLAFFIFLAKGDGITEDIFTKENISKYLLQSVFIMLIPLIYPVYILVKRIVKEKKKDAN